MNNLIAENRLYCQQCLKIRGIVPFEKKEQKHAPGTNKTDMVHGCHANHVLFKLFFLTSSSIEIILPMKINLSFFLKPKCKMFFHTKNAN